MIAYGYDNRGWFTGEVDRQPSPLEPGKFLIPLGTTTTKPPVLKSHYYRPKWNGENWEIIFDTTVQRVFLVGETFIRSFDVPLGAAGIVVSGKYPDCLKKNGEIEGLGLFEVDYEKTRKREKRNERAEKLLGLREARRSLFGKVDLIVNDFVLGETPFTKDQIKTYRKALKDVTERFKNFETNESHANALDGLDLNTFVWPTI